MFSFTTEEGAVFIFINNKRVRLLFFILSYHILIRFDSNYIHFHPSKVLQQLHGLFMVPLSLNEDLFNDRYA